MLGNTFQADWLKLVFQNIAVPLIGDAGGLQPSVVAGNLYISLHSADPGPGGDQTTNEISYTGYARVPVPRDNTHWTVSGSSPAQAANTNAVTFGTCSAGSATGLFYMIGTALSGAGKLLGRGPLVTTFFDFTAKASSDVITGPGHTLIVNDPLVFVDLPEGTLPTGITEGVLYYVKTVSGNDITISTTPGGATLDITADGAGMFGKLTSLAISAGVTPQFNAGQLVALAQ